MVSPGVPLDTPELVQARNFGRPVIGELELAARFLKGKILAITGSNGKTTTTALAGEILKESGLPTLVAGNIGVPVVGLIDESTDRHVVGAGGVELSARKHGAVPSRDRSHPEHHARPSRPARHL